MATGAHSALKISPAARIKVIGMGGGGGNVVNAMIRSGFDGVEFIACNTDVQALQASLAPHKIQLGKQLTRGLGAGSDPDLGRDAALEDRHELTEILAGADMVFLTAGMGGGTGTGGISVVAQIARELGALTVGVVTKPFDFEGRRRRKYAEAGIARLRESVDTLITIPNQRLLKIATPDLSISSAFAMVDNILLNAVKGINDIINIPALINVDFADVKAVMSSMGHALMGIGYGGNGKNAVDAAREAIASPLLEDVDIDGATGILIHIMAGPSIPLMQINEACAIVEEAAHEDANIIFGAVIDESLGDNLRVTVIATGFPVDELNEGSEMDSVSSTMAANLKRSRQPMPARRSVTHRAPGSQVFSSSQSSKPVADSIPSFPEASRRNAVATQESATNRSSSGSIQAQENFQLAKLTMEIAETSDEEVGSFASNSEEALPRMGASAGSPEGRNLLMQDEPFVGMDSLTSKNAVGRDPNVFGDDHSDDFSARGKQSLSGNSEDAIASGAHGGIFADDIDQKIDEALGIRASNRGGRDDLENLEVPAFMRNGKASLPLP